MARKKSNHAGITGDCWLYLNDQLELDPKSWEHDFLEHNRHDFSTGYSTQTAWERHRDVILPGWIARHPGTRPYCWWRFESGLQRKRGPMRLGNTVAKNVIYSLRDSIPEDQRAWLAEHGNLQDGE
jgi:hypothetical protein